MDVRFSLLRLLGLRHKDICHRRHQKTCFDDLQQSRVRRVLTNRGFSDFTCVVTQQAVACSGIAVLRFFNAVLLQWRSTMDLERNVFAREEEIRVFFIVNCRNIPNSRCPFDQMIGISCHAEPVAGSSSSRGSALNPFQCIDEPRATPPPSFHS